MNISELASRIFDAQPDSYTTDDLISISALPDRTMISSFFVDPRTNVDLFADYTDSQLAECFAECNSLTAAISKVETLVSIQALNAEESDLACDFVLRATLNAVTEIGASRQLHGSMLEPVLINVVIKLRQFLGQFQT